MPAYPSKALDARAEDRPASLSFEGERRQGPAQRSCSQRRVPLKVQPGDQALELRGDAGRAGSQAAACAALSARRRWRSGRASSPAWSAAGLPLERALTALADEARTTASANSSPPASEVNAGSPFARALASAPREFDEITAPWWRRASRAAALGAVLERLADDLEERQALKAKLIGATPIRPSCRDRGHHRHLPRDLRGAAGGAVFVGSNAPCRC